MNMEKFESKLAILRTELKSNNFDESGKMVLTRAHDEIVFDNIRRRQFYSRFSILKLDAEEYLLEHDTEKDRELGTKLYEQIDSILSNLKIVRLKSRLNIVLKTLDTFTRFTGVFCTFVICGFVSPLLILFRAIEETLWKTDPFEYVSERLKRTVPLSILLQCGVTFEVENLSRNHFVEPCSVLTFSHASNLDGFFVSGTCPIRQLAFAKKEVFALPFFAWISLAMGGIPVDRNNRDRAVGALKRAASLSKQNKVCIAIAPEGTRSPSGQLLPFKKGTFYMWEELNSPLLPFVIFGSHELFNAGNWVNESTGQVTVRYLKPIYPNEASSRDHMMRILRRKMLETMIDCPSNVGQSITYDRYAACMLVNLLSIAIVAVTTYLSYQHFVVAIGLRVSVAVGAWLAGVFLVTFVLYVYYVYIVDFFRPDETASKTSGKKNL